MAETTTGTPAIEIVGLTKVYGKTRALDGVDLEVPQGSVFGFLGPNGAGKTTTLRILTGLATPDQGTARILGRDVTDVDNDVRSDIGFLPDVPGFYPWMTAEEFLRFSGGLFGIAGEALDARVKALLELAGLTGVKQKVGGYSRGMKQRLGVAQALINSPKILMLDEPTSALDPIGRKEVLDMITALAGRTTVFFSTHILSDVERVCDTVAILHKGTVVTQAPINELKERYGSQKLVLEVTAQSNELASLFSAASWCAGVEHTNGRGLTLTVSDIEAARVAVPAEVAARGLGLIRLEAGEVSLEEVFVDLVGGGQ
ncbi:MAG: ABC transporter ATP-binding protein [Coriobacteriia bacterium]|nr:ABC transporter ATP-binding protein [Coriobacteriia bacterium]MBN2823322.1 ABC transporter ATP-binding protein [Coriobacteriia bacterium]